MTSRNAVYNSEEQKGYANTESSRAGGAAAEFVEFNKLSKSRC